MLLKEVDGQLKAYKTSVDVINGLDEYKEFLVSEHIAEDLRKDPNFLREDYWYLTVGKAATPDPNSDLLEFDISIHDGVLQKPIRGEVCFRDGRPVLEKGDS
ncbi:MAG: hypothetical protein WBA43_14995 [Elainellaceae cyanobacterium]